VISMQGVRVDLISADRLKHMPSIEKIRLILDKVREGTIVILESGLTPEEQGELIEMTMLEIVPDRFSGIEIETYPGRTRPGGVLSRLISAGSDDVGSRLTVIGPANQLTMIQKNQDLLSAWLTTG